AVVIRSGAAADRVVMSPHDDDLAPTGSPGQFGDEVAHHLSVHLVCLALHEIADVATAQGRLQPDGGALQTFGFAEVALADAVDEDVEGSGEILSVNGTPIEGGRLESFGLIGIQRGRFLSQIGKDHRRRVDKDQPAAKGYEEKPV